MAESKSALIAKTVQKHAGRAKEKILQNLGKVDRTADEIFDEHLQNFTRQQNQATRLQKEFNNYIRCIRAAQTASKSLMEAISEVYESNWSGHDLLYAQAQNMEMLWQDYSHKLGDQVLIPLNTYQGQFPETRKKIDKRGRKLVDYDSQRHSFQGLQANAAKRRDDVKITRGREMMEEAKRTYEILNSELHDELPALHDSRILFLVTNLQTLFASEQVFHSESSKVCCNVYNELEAIVDKLATDSQRGSYTIKKPILGTLPSLQHNNISPPSSPNNGKNNSLNSQNGNATPTNTIQPWSENSPSTPEKSSPVTDKPSTPVTPNSPELIKKVEDETVEKAPASPVVNGNGTHKPQENNNQKVEELYDIPVGATLSNLPPGVLYRVRATYRYTREDQDELSFEVGDTIRVIEYEDPDEQEEGWLMGIKENSNDKGMFPANFTRPI
ncbi:amphiphysin isoform X2 [Arctopsyche grandis]|uniref:amphiphysin isoform X2 n=1 Tax=Arctopsyche grandis TaxID=121162 RepID=UPI00406D82DE